MRIFSGRERERRIDFLVMGGTAGSHYAARLLRRAAAGSFGWLSSPRPLPQPIKKLKRREWLRQSSTESATDTQVAFSGCKVFTCSELMVVSIMLIEKRKHSAKNFRRGTSQSTIKLTLLLLQNRLIHTEGRANEVYVNARSNKLLCIFQSLRFTTFCQAVVVAGGKLSV